MSENGKLKYIRSVEKHSKGEIFQYNIYQANNDCVVREINGRRVFEVNLKRNDFLYVHNKELKEWSSTVQQNTFGSYTHETVFDVRDEFLVAYQGVLTENGTQFTTSEILSHTNGISMKKQIKLWIEELNKKYAKVEVTNILAFSRYD